VTLLLHHNSYFYPQLQARPPSSASSCPAPFLVPSWDPAAVGTRLRSCPQGSQWGMQEGPLPFVFGHHFCGPHPLPHAKALLFSLTSSWSLFFRRTYTYIHGLCYFPLPNGLQVPSSGPSSKLRAPWGLGAGKFAWSF